VSAGRLIAFQRTAATEPWLSKRQIAGHYGRSTRWIELRMREGLPSRMLGGRRAFRLSTVDAWMEARYS
jgi:predicted DNA-binding transcriptional regulator AlpA